MASQKHVKKRESRIRAEMLRHGTPEQGHGWAARQAARRFGRKGARRARRGIGRTQGYQMSK